MDPLAATFLTLLVVLTVIASPFLLSATVNWLWYRRFVIDYDGEPARPLVRPEAQRAHRLPLLRSAMLLALLSPCGLAVSLVFDVPYATTLGLVVPLAAAVVPMTWAERAYGGQPGLVVVMALAIGTAAGLVAIVNALTVSQGGGPDAWLAFLQERLDRRADSFALLLLLCVPALTLWGVPCAIVTDVRVRDGAQLLAMVIVAFVSVGPAVLSIAVLEVAYRLAARVDAWLGRDDEGAAPG